MPERRTVSTVNSNNSAAAASNGHASRGGQRTQRNNANRQQGKGEGRRFHPNLITAQIVSFQCLQYLAQSILFQINALLYENSTVSVDRLFTDKYVHLWKSQGWPDCAAIFFAALIGSFLLTIIVEKSKLCLDFSATYFILHLLISSFYYQVPATVDWWIVHIMATIVMVLVGVVLAGLMYDILKGFST